VENGEVEVRYVPTANQVVDILTKGLPRDRFKFLQARLSLILSLVHASSVVARRLSTSDYSTSMQSDLRGSIRVV